MTTPIRKVLIAEFGDESKIHIVHDDLPAPPANHVQIRVLYAGFSGTDINMRRGIYPMQKKAPITPGSCLVGTVTQNGPSSSRFQSGDLVCCMSIYDAEATHANLPEAYLVLVPVGMDPKKAVPLIIDWNTAYGMVMHQAKVSKGQKIFVHGISGAVGWALAVLSTLQGAEVYGTASSRNHSAIASGLPGTTVFDYANKDWIQAMKDIGGVDAVFDALGFESWDESFSILHCSGFLVGYGGNLPALTGRPEKSMIPPIAKLFLQNLKFWDGRRATFYWISRDRSTFVPDLAALFELSQSGKVEIPVKKVFTLDGIREAHLTWSKQSGVGSILIDCA